MTRLSPGDQDTLQRANPKASSRLAEVKCTLVRCQTWNHDKEYSDLNGIGGKHKINEIFSCNDTPWNLFMDLLVAENLSSSCTFVCWNWLTSWCVSITDNLHVNKSSIIREWLQKTVAKNYTKSNDTHTNMLLPPRKGSLKIACGLINNSISTRARVNEAKYQTREMLTVPWEKTY